MSYEPTNWQAGDTVTSAKLNKLEQGVAASSGSNGVMIVEPVFEDNTLRLDKTWKEINDTLRTSVAIVHMEGPDMNSQCPVFATTSDPEHENYVVYVFRLFDAQPFQFFTDTENGYPIIAD